MYTPYGSTKIYRKQVKRRISSTTQMISKRTFSDKNFADREYLDQVTPVRVWLSIK